MYFTFVVTNPRHEFNKILEARRNTNFITQINRKVIFSWHVSLSQNNSLWLCPLWMIVSFSNEGFFHRDHLSNERQSQELSGIVVDICDTQISFSLLQFHDTSRNGFQEFSVLCRQMNTFHISFDFLLYAFSCDFWYPWQFYLYNHKTHKERFFLWCDYK